MGFRRLGFGGMQWRGTLCGDRWWIPDMEDLGGVGGDGVLIVCRGLMVCACGRLLGSDKTPFNDLLALRWGMALLSGFGMIRGVGSSL